MTKKSRVQLPAVPLQVITLACLVSHPPMGLMAWEKRGEADEHPAYALQEHGTFTLPVQHHWNTSSEVQLPLMQLLKHPSIQAFLKHVYKQYSFVSQEINWQLVSCKKWHHIEEVWTKIYHSEIKLQLHQCRHSMRDTEITANWNIMSEYVEFCVPQHRSFWVTVTTINNQILTAKSFKLHL